MGYYAIAIGGTGNKILESIVYGACTDAFYLNKGKNREPLPLVRLLAVDVDAACGNTTRAKQAAEYYERVRANLSAYPVTWNGFNTELRVERWNINLSKRASSVESLVQNHKQDQLLARALFNSNEASLEYSEGFRGHPDLGVLFFADILEGMESSKAAGQPDEMLSLLDEMQAEMDRGESVKVILLGSIFGGTGAAGIPAISQFLRKRFKAQSRLFELAAVLMLPYYKVPPSSQNEEMEIVVKSSSFLDKARTALQYYGMQGMIRSGEEDPAGIYDAVYLLGIPPEGFVTTRIYSTGSQSQENDAHMLEWLAMRCTARFFRTGFRGEHSNNIDCYYYQLHSRTFSWESFDEDAQLYRIGFGGLLKASAVFFAECYPYLRAAMAGEVKGRRNAVNYYSAWFYGADKLSAPDRATLEKHLHALYHCLAFYCNWMFQLIRTLPPTLRTNRALEEAVEEAGSRYQEMVDMHVLLGERERSLEGRQATDAERETYQELKEDYGKLVRLQHEAVRRIGGSLQLGVLKEAQQRQQERLRLQRQAIAGLEEQIRGWRNEDSQLIDRHMLNQEEERLAAMRYRGETMEEKRKKIAADIATAIRENIIVSIPAPEEEPGDILPKNGLFDGQMLTMLHDLLSQYGLKHEARDLSHIEKLSAALLRKLEQLIVHTVPDKADAVRVIAGIGSGTIRCANPDAMMAGFWASLRNAVLEEGTV